MVSTNLLVLQSPIKPSMAYPALVIFAIVFLFACSEAFHDLDYSDLQALGVSCPMHDKCSGSTNSTILTTNCKCDPLCYSHDDCCIDAPRYVEVPPSRIRGLKCYPDFENLRGVYAISKCSQDWAGPPTVKDKCERLNDLSDPLVAAPATDTAHNVTYRNRYCSECNHANSSDLKSWVISLNCDSLLNSNMADNITDEYIWEHLIYKTTYPHRNRWGINYWNPEQDRDTFYPCKLIFNYPDYLLDHVRYCMPGLVSTCLPTWRRNVIRRKCESYMSLVFSETEAYKNPHCALCNRVNLTSLLCPTSVNSRKKPPMSFTLLLDINLNDGNKVGEINPCPEGKKYDAFFKKCRKLVCALPGYRLEGDKCVQS